MLIKQKTKTQRKNSEKINKTKMWFSENIKNTYIPQLESSTKK